MDLALNNLQWLICHQTKPVNRPTSQLNRKIYSGYKNIIT